jgi:hypothetical protein
MVINLLIGSLIIIIFAIYKIFQIRIDIINYNVIVYFWNFNKKKRMNIIFKL